MTTFTFSDSECWEKDVVVPEKFDFPFQPYDIQLGFMRQLYKCLEQGRVGIFESPTGTVSMQVV